jgi:CRP-like cAMP-binding protein
MAISHETDSKPDTTAPNRHACASPDACVGCLASSVLTDEMTESQIAGLFRMATVRRLSRGEVLISEGGGDSALFVVAKGELVVERIHNGESGVPLAHLHAGMMAGQFTFLGGSKRTATVTAAADGTCVIAIERASVESILASDPLLVYRLMRAILRSATSTIETMNKGFVDSIQYIRG